VVVTLIMISVVNVMDQVSLLLSVIVKKTPEIVLVNAVV